MCPGTWWRWMCPAINCAWRVTFQGAGCSCCRRTSVPTAKKEATGFTKKNRSWLTGKVCRVFSFLLKVYRFKLKIHRPFTIFQASNEVNQVNPGSQSSMVLIIHGFCSSVALRWTVKDLLVSKPLMFVSHTAWWLRHPASSKTACDGYFCDHYTHDQCCCCCCCWSHTYPPVAKSKGTQSHHTSRTHRTIWG